MQIDEIHSYASALHTFNFPSFPADQPGAIPRAQTTKAEKST
jgi:hypothetical protein